MMDRSGMYTSRGEEQPWFQNPVIDILRLLSTDTLYENREVRVGSYRFKEYDLQAARTAFANCKVDEGFIVGRRLHFEFESMKELEAAKTVAGPVMDLLRGMEVLDVFFCGKTGVRFDLTREVEIQGLDSPTE